MDMKKILQTLNGASTKPVQDSSDMKKFLQIVESTYPSNRLTQSESIAVQTYTSPKQRKTINSTVLNVNKDARPSMIGKYFKQIEEEFQEREQQYKDRSRQLAERVIKEVGGNHGYFSKLKTHLDKSKNPPKNVVQLAKNSTKKSNRHYSKIRKEETEGVDSVTLDIPLLIRLLEFSREDAKDDMILHKIAERMIGMQEEGQSLSMSDYDNIIGSVKEAHGNSKIYDKCWTGYKKVPGKKRGEKGSCVKK